MHAENPLIPMGALTGRPDRAQIHAVLSRYREAGIEQYLIYPRSGCELDYLSEEFLDTVEVICEEAEALGFRALWLYDEFNWPSGNCAGQVPRSNPVFAARHLCAIREGGSIRVEVRCNPDYTDLMNPSAVDCFLALTHERYYARLKRWFGTLIQGIFTDEPEIGHFGPAPEGCCFRMGYYDGLEEDYRKLTGGDLKQDLAAGLRGDPDYYPVVCAPLLAKRFRTCFIDRVQNWCQAHGIVLTGHLMNESLPLQARKSNGRILTALDGMGLPGMDDIRCLADPGGLDFLTYGTVQHAIDQRRVGGLAELYATCPTDISFARLTQMLFLAAAFGIDHYVLAVAAMDPRGNAVKQQYYNSFASDIPQLAAFPAWAKVARRAAFLATRPRKYDVGVRYGDNAPGLPSLLRDLTAHQFSWRLLAPEEPIPEDLPFVFAIGATGVTEERTNSRALNFSAMHLRLSERISPAEEIRCADGTPTHEVFLRRYQDGGLLVANLAGRDLHLILHRGRHELPFVLQTHGVREFPGWRLDFDLPHLLRVEFGTQQEAAVELERPQRLRLALRKYAGTDMAYWDGREIHANDECIGLPVTFRQLYREVSLGSVESGRHVLRLPSGTVDYPFLPAALLLGDDLPDFTGRVCQSARIHVPETALKARVPGGITPGDMELFLNGSSLGVRLAAPYEWLLPPEVHGETVEVRLVYSASIAGLFGHPHPGDDEFSSILRALFAPEYRHAPDFFEVDFE